MKERPVLFSGDMVRAILKGRKTQTRRPVKDMPPMPIENYHTQHTKKHDVPYFDAYCGEKKTAVNPRGMGILWNWWQVDDRACLPQIKCPYGQPGDRFWVRETWWGAFTYEEGSDSSYGDLKMKRPIKYAATETPENTPNRCYPKGLQKGFAAPDPYCMWFKLPSIHMPRWASRITLDIISVRVERVLDISEYDAKAEGFPSTADFKNTFFAIYQNAGTNPWVWVVEFVKI